MDNMEGIMQSKISQRKINTVWFHLYVETKKTNEQALQNKRVRDTDNKQVVARGGKGEGKKEVGEGD